MLFFVDVFLHFVVFVSIAFVETFALFIVFLGSLHNLLQPIALFLKSFVLLQQRVVFDASFGSVRAFSF